MTGAGYKWQIITDNGECFTEASDKGNTLKDAMRQGYAKRVAFFCEGSVLPRVEMVLPNKAELVFCRVLMNDPDYRDVDRSHLIRAGKKLPRAPRRHYQFVGFTINGVTCLNQIDLDTGVVTMKSMGWN